MEKGNLNYPYPPQSPQQRKPTVGSKGSTSRFPRPTENFKLGSILFVDLFDPGEPLPYGERRLDAFLNRHPIDALNLRPQRGLRAGAAAGTMLL
jgi:hypothetical protein